MPSISGDFRLPDGQWQYVLKEHPHIGYIRLNQFGEKSGAEIQVFYKQTAGNIDGFGFGFAK